MGFHRLQVPVYTGGLPGGYDYINNALVGTPALADGPRAAGPNAGTYFVGFGENALGATANRGLKALAENTDYLDNLLRRDIAVPTRTPDATAAGATGTVTITGPGIFLGAAGTPNTVAGINTFLELTDDKDNEIVDGSLTPCQITAVSGGTVGSGGFSAGNLILTITPPIPDTKVYRVYYGARSNLASLPVDAFSNIKIRGAQEVSAELESTGGSQLIGTVAITSAYYTYVAGTLKATLDTLAASIDNTHATVVDHTRLLTTIRTMAATGGLDPGGVLDGTIILNPGAAFAINLPAAASFTGRRLFLADKSGTMSLTNKVTLTRSGGVGNIDGVAADYDLTTPFGRWILTSDGTDWYLFSC